MSHRQFQIQTWGDTMEEVIRNAEKIASFDSKIVVKVPITKDGNAQSSTKAPMLLLPSL
jgi:transaldolase